MKHARILLLVMFTLLVANCSPSAWAEDKVAKLEARLKALEKELAVLKKVGNIAKTGKGTLSLGHESVTGGTVSAKAILASSEWEKDLDRPITADAAAFVIGNGDQVPEVTNVRALSASVISGLNPQGKIQNGFGVAMNLGAAWDYMRYKDFYNCVGKLSDDNSKYFERLLHRSTISFATTKAQNTTDPSLRLAVGLGTLLYDHLDTNANGDTEPKRVARQLGFLENMEPADIYQALQNRRVKSGVSIGIVPTFATASGKFSDLGYDGYTAYLAATAVLTWDNIKTMSPMAPFKTTDNYLIGLSAVAKWKGDEQTVNATTKAVGRQNSMNFAGRVSYGTPEVSGAVEAGYIQIFNGLHAHENAWQVSGNLTFHVAKDIYFVINVGQKLAGDGEFFSTGGFQIGAADAVSGKK